MAASSKIKAIARGPVGTWAVVVAVLALALSLSYPWLAPEAEPVEGAPSQPSARKGSDSRQPPEPDRAKAKVIKMARPAVVEGDLEVLAPDEHELRELEARDFELSGGIEAPGTDPEGAHLKVGTPRWAEEQQAALRASLNDHVLTQGVILDRLECQRGRCLIELKFEAMDRALERSKALRQWLTTEVPCRSHTQGPDEGESPAILPSQQIWILCGEPDR